MLGWLNAKPEIRIDSAEVDEVILIPLERLTDQDSRRDREMETLTGRISVPGFEINGHFIWGATAMMLAELVDIIQGDTQL